MKGAPAVFFAFANDREAGGAYLRNLAEEERGVRGALAGAEDAGCCVVLPVEHNATLERILDVFQSRRWADRIAIFHYGGHAGSDALLLETRDGGRSAAHAAGLADFLGRQRGLELVFLNGCSTAGHVERLLAAGVRSVIATSEAIDDAVATELAIRFYKALGLGRELRSAFAEAEAAVRAGRKRPWDAYRNLSPPAAGEPQPEWPWKLYPQGEGASRWALPSSGRPIRRAARIEPKRLLPYRCDRSPQAARLEVAVPEHRRVRPGRPLVLLVHGHFREAHDMFVERLEVDLPPLLDVDGEQESIPRKGPCFFTDPRAGTIDERCAVLRRAVAEVLGCDPEADLAAMAAAVAGEGGPLLVDVAIAVNELNPIPEKRLLAAWLAELSAWPDLAAAQPLVFVLRLSWEGEAAGPSLLSIFKRSTGDKVERLVRALARAPVGGRLGVVALVERLVRALVRPAAGGRLGVVPLPPLESVGEDEVVGWIEEHATPWLRQAGGEQATAWAEDLRERVERFFARSGKKRIPMARVGRTLRRHLRESLHQGPVTQ